MTLVNLTYIISELNASLDSGRFDGISVQEAFQHIQAGDVVPWLEEAVDDIDLSLLKPEIVEEYHAALADIHGAYAGYERRKWGVEKRGLCLLIAWTNELIQRRRWQAE